MPSSVTQSDFTTSQISSSVRSEGMSQLFGSESDGLDEVELFLERWNELKKDDGRSREVKWFVEEFKYNALKAKTAIKANDDNIMKVSIFLKGKTRSGEIKLKLKNESKQLFESNRRINKGIKVLILQTVMHVYPFKYSWKLWDGNERRQG